MKHESTRSGWVRTNLTGKLAYASFVPADLPPVPPVALDRDMQKLLSLSREKLAELQAEARHIPNVEIFLSMYVRKEALFSSQIEGTQATLDDILDPSIDENGNRDVAEASDNVRAALYAIGQIKSQNGLPLSLRLLKETHRVLLTHARGAEKSPGSFRTTQNWIGPAGCGLRSASYVPPNPEDMTEGLYALESYIHDESDLDPLLRAGLIHYQFETIHPFADGNGRIGRLLILLFLLEQGVISEPYLYVSYFLKLNRTRYYDALMNVREKGDYESWLKFFLHASYAAAEDALHTIEKLRDVKAKSANAVLAGCSGTARRAKRLAFLEYLEKRPIIEIGRTAEELGWSFPTTSKYVKDFMAAGILTETTGRRRSRIFSYEPYLTVLRKDTEPLQLRY